MFSLDSGQSVVLTQELTMNVGHSISAEQLSFVETDFCTREKHPFANIAMWQAKSGVGSAV